MFHDVRMPEHIERGAEGGPLFNTTVLGMASGIEQRNQDWEFARQQWDVSYGMQDQADYDTIREFFYARKGRAFGFRFKDWSDYQMDDVLIDLGDGNETSFQIVKLYEDDAATYTRKITRPVASTVKVFVDGVEQTEGTDYSLGSLGVINFTSAPANGTEITVTCEFDVPVRFNVDKMNLSLTWVDAGEFPDIEIIELKE